MNAPEVWWSPSLAEDLSQGGLVERTGPDLWHQEHGTWQRLDELPADAVRLVPDDVSHQARILAHEACEHERKAWRRGYDEARAEFEQPAPAVPDTGQAPESPTASTPKAGRWGSSEAETATGAAQAPDVADLAYARSEVDKWLADNSPYCILPTRTEHIPALLARLDELEGTR